MTKQNSNSVTGSRRNFTMKEFVYLCACALIVILADSAKILTVVPTPSISHQVVFRPLVQELVKRGHEVTIITTDPAFPADRAPENLTEIDLHDISYETWREMIFASGLTSGSSNDIITQIKKMTLVMSEVFLKQINTQPVQSILNNTRKPDFDLLILEACSSIALIYSHIFKNTPVIQMSSFGGLQYNFDAMGATSRPPLLYPTMLRQRLTNLSLWEKIHELYHHYLFEDIFDQLIATQDKFLKSLFGEDVPTINELEKNVGLLLLNMHPIWDFNRPVPPSIKYIGGIHQKPTSELPKDLKSYLDNSKHGVIYISFGTNVSPSQLPQERIQMLVTAFSKLPYDVLWKWDKDELPGRSKNIKISKWLPQSDLLKHPKIKVFITQGGLQSTDEAINAGVPLIGMPMLGDQWYNVEQYVKHKVGLRLDLDTLTEEKFLTGINTIANDDSYRKNMVNLRTLMRDEPMPALERAVWWVEHILRHGGGRHLRAPAAGLTWAEYLDVEVMAVVAVAAVSGFTVLGVLLYMLLGFVKQHLISSRKLKTN